MNDWHPTPEQTANAQARVGATWARLLAERHPGHRFVIEWRERPQATDAPPLTRKVAGEIIDQQTGRTAA